MRPEPGCRRLPEHLPLAARQQTPRPLFPGQEPSREGPGQAAPPQNEELGCGALRPEPEALSHLPRTSPGGRHALPTADPCPTAPRLPSARLPPSAGPLARAASARPVGPFTSVSGALRSRRQTRPAATGEPRAARPARPLRSRPPGPALKPARDVTRRGPTSAPEAAGAGRGAEPGAPAASASASRGPASAPSATG